MGIVKKEGKSRFYIREDGSKIITNAYFDDETNLDVFASKFKWISVIEIDDEQVKNFNIEQLSIQDGKLAIDENWEENIMPSSAIAKRHLKNINNKIDALLSSEDFDAREAFKCLLEIERSKFRTENEWLKTAHENLKKSGVDKPIIREKLINKINQ